jgi:putative membrane protein
MFLEILLAIFIGVYAGVITGLIPGIHVNLISLLVISISRYLLRFTNALVVGCFIISMAIVHTFLDAIPSIFLGAPDADQALNVLPGHKLLLRGMGYEAVRLTVIGSLLALILTVMIIPFMIPYVPRVYEFLLPYIGYILIGISVFMILKEKSLNRIFWSFFIFMISGILGLLTLNWPNLRNPLFPLLSGLFGISTLAIPLIQHVEMPKQRITEMIKVSSLNKIKAILAAVFSGSLIGIFPGLGAAQAAIVAMQLVGKIGMYSFMILIGGINTVNFVFSLVTFYTLQKARNGAIVAVMEILKQIDINGLIVFLCVVLIAGGIATFLAFFIARIFSKVVNNINYNLLVIFIISFITILVFAFSGFVGFLILVTSTAIGLIPILINVKRSNAMGCLLVPVILFFVL